MSQSRSLFESQTRKISTQQDVLKQNIHAELANQETQVRQRFEIKLQALEHINA